MTSKAPISTPRSGKTSTRKRTDANGHYHHLDTINRVKHHGSIAKFIKEENVQDGIMYALEKNNVLYVLAGSIRDDGPLPPVIGNAYEAQGAMRDHIRKATTVDLHGHHAAHHRHG